MRSVCSLFRIGVDLDGVLNNLDEMVLRELKTRGAVPPTATAEQITDYNYKAFPDVTGDMLNEIFMDGRVFRIAEPNLAARSVMHELMNQGAEIHIVTSRKLSMAHQGWTHEWLRKCNFPYTWLALKDKAEKLHYAEFNCLDFFIEDHLPTALAMADICRLSILLNKPYNQTTTDEECSTLMRAYSWEHIGEFFLGPRAGR